jgi:hypothetical protein
LHEIKLSVKKIIVSINVNSFLAIIQDTLFIEFRKGEIVAHVTSPLRMHCGRRGNINTKSPLGPLTTKGQDVILYNFDKQQETHLHSENKMAVVTPYNAVLMVW